MFEQTWYQEDEVDVNAAPEAADSGEEDGIEEEEVIGLYDQVSNYFFGNSDETESDDVGDS